MNRGPRRTTGQPQAAATSRPEPSATAGAPTALLVVALVVGAWALVPPYSGPELATETRKEVADHVVPGVLLLVLVLAASFGAYRSELAMLVLGLGIALAGIWMTSTHVPLVLQALRDEVGWAPTVWHTLPGLAVLAVGAAWSWRYLHEEPEQPDAGGDVAGSRTGAG